MKIQRAVAVSAGAVAVLWIVRLADVVLPADLRAYGVRPRLWDGLWGVLWMPWLHGSWAHLAANTGALFFLLFISLLMGGTLTLLALAIILFGGGGFVWLFGAQGTVHIGASGVIFGLIGFLSFAGIFRRDWKALVASVFVLVLYGAVLFSLFEREQGVSWAGHFYGFVSGVGAAWVTRGLGKGGKMPAT